MLKSNILSWFLETGIVLFTTGMIISSSPRLVMASEEIVFKYGGVTETVPLSELQNFARTGETSPSIDFLLGIGKQNPQGARQVLKQQFPADTRLVYNLLNTAPGEYVLSRTDNFVGTKSERANVKALRGAIIKSASDDNLISLIELLEDYPTKKVYVNSRALIKAQRNLVSFIKETSKYIRIPLNILSN